VIATPTAPGAASVEVFTLEAQAGEGAREHWRRLARASVQAGDTRRVAAADAPAFAGYLCERLAAVLQIPPAEVDSAAPLARLGVDSISALRLAHAIEADLGPVVSVARLLAGATVDELARELAETSRAERAAALQSSESKEHWQEFEL
jgi:hypothetical protein